MEFNQQLYAKRRRSNAIGLTLSLGAMALGLFVLLWILSAVSYTHLTLPTNREV